MNKDERIEEVCRIFKEFLYYNNLGEYQIADEYLLELADNHINWLISLASAYILKNQ